MTFFTIFILVLLCAGAVTYFLGRENTLALMFGPGDQGRTLFKTFKRSNRPNNALICPEDFCDHAVPEIVAPTYAISADQLREKMRLSLKTEHRLERVHTNDPAMRERYLQRSELFRFPDTIQVEYIPLGPNSSTIALYSAAQIGVSDAGVNRKRLKRWLKRLQEFEINADSVAA